jgi:hypothetical protein
MSDHSRIEWWGCDHCYAVRMAQVIIDHPKPSLEQKAIVAELRDTLRDTALTIEPKARDE